MSIRLIVNADDYGFTPGVSAGIRQAHLDGIVTSTSAMMNVPTAQDDVVRMVEHCPKLGAGVHLVLTAGRPLRPADKVPTLVDSTGAFFDYMGVRSRVGQFKKGELRDEWRTQIEAFIGAGKKPDHLDSHHHVSYWSETTFEVMLALADEYSLPIRCPLQMGEEHATPDFVVEALKSHLVRYPDRMIGSFYDNTATLDGILKILTDLPEGTSELMTHPGLVDDELRARDSYTDPRIRELSILSGSHVREQIAARHIQLITFAQL